jgi:hypothetical protein
LEIQENLNNLIQDNELQNEIQSSNIGSENYIENEKNFFEDQKKILSYQ